MFSLLGYPESSLVKSKQFKCKLPNVYLYLHSVYFVLCIIESEIRRVSRWETEAVEAAAAHNVATPHTLILTTSPPCPQTFFFKKQTKTKKNKQKQQNSQIRTHGIVTAQYLKVFKSF